jgi:hypothetical protein
MRTVEKLQSAHLEAEALIEEARRHRGRRHLMLWSCLLIAAAGTITIVLALGVGDGSPSSGSRHAEGVRVVSRVPGARTSLVVWPSAHCCTRTNSMSVFDLVTGRLRSFSFVPMGGGDVPDKLLRVGDELVFQGDAGVMAESDTIRGPPHVVGRATYFLPTSRPGRVLLYTGTPGRGGGSVRSAAVAGSTVGPSVTLPKGALPLEGTPNGLLLLSTRSSLALWRAPGAPVVLAHLDRRATVLAAAAPGLVGYGTDCRTREATNGSFHTSVGYVSCGDLVVLELRSRRTVTIPRPSGTEGWVPSGQFGLADGQVSPNGRLLVAEGLIGASSGDVRSYLLHVSTRGSSPSSMPGSVTELGSLAAWSRTSRWLFFEGDGQGAVHAFLVTKGRSLKLQEKLSTLGPFALVAIPSRTEKG